MRLLRRERIAGARPTCSIDSVVSAPAKEAIAIVAQRERRQAEELPPSDRFAKVQVAGPFSGLIEEFVEVQKHVGHGGPGGQLHSVGCARPAIRPASFRASSGLAAKRVARFFIKRDQPGSLVVARRAGEAQAKRIADLVGRGRPTIADEPPRQGLRGFHVDRIVQRYQGLQRRVRPRPPQGAHFAAGRIERDHRGIGVRPPPRRVDRAAIAVLALAGFPIHRAAECRDQPERRLQGPHRRAEHLRAQAGRSPPGSGRGSLRHRGGSAGRGRAGGCPGRARAAPARLDATTVDTRPT